MRFLFLFSTTKSSYREVGSFSMMHPVLFALLLLTFIISTQTHPNETCYQVRDYLREEEVSGVISPIPILFLSMPGSGSTYARLLLEFATGLFTGSLYTDAHLAQLMPGDRFCGLRLAAIKSYPNDVIFSNSTNEPLFIVPDKEMKRKCKKGLITEFSRVIVLLRDPFHTIWSAYQRTMYTSTSHPMQLQQTNDGTSSSNSNEDTSRIHKKRKGLLVHDVGIHSKEFNKNHWETTALSNMQAFANTWNEVYTNIFQFFKHWNVHVIRYEDLTNSTHPHVQLNAVRNTIKFMRHSINESRIRCAFDLVVMERIANTSTMVSIDQAYSNTVLVCAMWNIIKNHTSLSSLYGYQIYSNHIC